MGSFFATTRSDEADPFDLFVARRSSTFRTVRFLCLDLGKNPHCRTAAVFLAWRIWLCMGVPKNLIHTRQKENIHENVPGK